MALHPLAGKPVPPELVPNIPRLMSAYYTRKPDLNNPAQRVGFGTSGHRGSVSYTHLTLPTILLV